MNKLTPAQTRWLAELRRTGFVEAGYLFGRSQKNGPLYRLVDKGLATVGWKPLQGYGFMPVVVSGGDPAAIGGRNTCGAEITPGGLLRPTQDNDTRDADVRATDEGKKHA
jgi:hypothetical protein